MEPDIDWTWQDEEDQEAHEKNPDRAVNLQLVAMGLGKLNALKKLVLMTSKTGKASSPKSAIPGCPSKLMVYFIPVLQVLELPIKTRIRDDKVPRNFPTGELGSQ